MKGRGSVVNDLLELQSLGHPARLSQVDGAATLALAALAKIK
jgi:hypothetical protein